MRPLLTLALLLCAALSALAAPAAPVNPMDWVGPTTYSMTYSDAKLSADGKTALLGSFSDEYVVLRLADKQIIARYLLESTAENVTATSSRGGRPPAMAISSHGERVAMCTKTGIYVYSTTGTRSPQLIPSDCPMILCCFHQIRQSWLSPMKMGCLQKLMWSQARPLDQSRSDSL